MMGKTQDPPLKKDKSTTTGKGVTEIDNAEKSSQDRSGDLTEDELAAFQKIMGDIDDQEEEKLNGTAKATGTAEKDKQALTEDKLARLSEEIETINSEDHTGVDIPDSTKTEAVHSDDGGDESLDEDQQRAFESIMAQIESGGLADADSGKETGDASEAEPADDDTAELEKVVREANTENTPDPVEARNDASIDGLDQEQQQALESIMAQIEGDGAADEATGSEKEAKVESEPEATDDDTAELEKVLKEVVAGDYTGPAEAQRDKLADDGLDEEQQQALESIMNEIEGGSTADAATRSGMETGDELESETVEGFSAELEKVVQKVNPAEHDEKQDADNTESDDTLSGDQQQAFESIMAQIEGGDTEQAAPESAILESIDAKADEASEHQAQRSTGSTQIKSDEDSQDISDDIDDILAEIAPSDDMSHLPEAATDDSGSEPAKLEVSEKTIVNDDIVARIGADGGLEHADRPQTSTPAGKNGKPTEPVEKPLTKGPSSDQRSAIKPIPASLKSLKKPEPLREATKSTGGRQKKVILASVVAIFFFALAGYFFGVPQNMVDSKTSAPDTDTSRQDAKVETQPSLQVKKPMDVVLGTSDQSRLKTVAENLDRLRNELIEKQTEIGELRAYYQAGIDAEIQEIADRVWNADKGTIPFKTAIADPRISLGLSAIQRRDTYIKKLDTPVDILFRNSEALLYFSRKAALLALMAGKTSDIDIDGFIKQANEIRNVHGSELAQLNIDGVPASPRMLESIWQDIEKRLPKKTVKPENNNRVKDTDNSTIWKNICEGDFSQKHKMTKLSPEAARCLVAWKGKDLFLSGLTDLSPDAARHLVAWEGDWLGLNGLNELSPEAAVHLSRWKGKGLSLNGLSRLSPRVVAILSDWPGDQIELVNVKHMAHWENPNTRLFLSEDMKRKLSVTRK